VRPPAELNRDLRSWLREDRHENADRVLLEALDTIAATDQRRAGWLARRFTIMNITTVRWGVAAAAVVAVAVAGYSLFLGSINVGPTPSDEATPTAAAILIEPTALGTDPLTAGTYYVDDPFQVPITFQLPDGWVVGEYNRAGSFLDLSSGFDPSGELTIQVVDNVFVDPCDPAAGPLEPPVGPSVDDLARALASLPNVDATAAVDVTVDGHAGKQLELTQAPGTAAACDGIALWTSSTRILNMGAEEIFEVLILDADGVRLVAAIGYIADVSEEALAEMHAVVDSIEIR
jgi:hypothetical protein